MGVNDSVVRTSYYRIKIGVCYSVVGYKEECNGDKTPILNKEFEFYARTKTHEDFLYIDDGFEMNLFTL